MPSLKIDIIVDDKGRPVINQVSESLRGVATSAEQANTMFRQHMGIMDGLRD